MGIDYIYPEFEVIRNESRCVTCQVCQRQCANEVHRCDPDLGRMLSDETKCVGCHRCVSLCPTHALKIVKNDCAFRENAWISALLSGMQAGVGAVIASVVFQMGLGVVKEKDPLSDLILAGAFIAAVVFNVNVVLVILACGAIGVIRTKWAHRPAAHMGAHMAKRRENR